MGTLGRRWPDTVWPCWLVGLLVACSSSPAASARDVADANDTGRTLDAKSDTDRAMLRELPTLPSKTPRQVGNATVVAEPSYASASGRSCRALRIKAAGHQPTARLACNDGKHWFFVPDVFGGSDSAE